jgi:hypothetical protein
MIEGIDWTYNVEYSPTQYTRLLELIEEQGGEHLDELCVSRGHVFDPSPSNGVGKVITMPGCGNYSIFLIPFESEMQGGLGLLETAKLCAVCDGLGFKPRFAEAMKW